MNLSTAPRTKSKNEHKAHRLQHASMFPSLGIPTMKEMYKQMTQESSFSHDTRLPTIHEKPYRHTYSVKSHKRPRETEEEEKEERQAEASESEKREQERQEQERRDRAQEEERQREREARRNVEKKQRERERKELKEFLGKVEGKKVLGPIKGTKKGGRRKNKTRKCCKNRQTKRQPRK